MNKTINWDTYELAFRCNICDTENKYGKIGYARCRNALRCKSCDSSVRERAIVAAYKESESSVDELNKFIHESSPRTNSLQGLTRYFKKYSKYTPSNLLKGGKKQTLEHSTIEVMNVDLQKMPFADNSVDLHLHSDVMEHVDSPGEAMTEMFRTLKPGGKAIFCCPILPIKQTKKVAYYDQSGDIRSALPYRPWKIEYHGNPIDDNGSPVTHIFGADALRVLSFFEPAFEIKQTKHYSTSKGIVGNMTDVFVCVKPEE